MNFLCYNLCPTSSTEHDVIDLVNDTDDKVVVIEIFYLPTVLTISLASTILSSSFLSLTSPESLIDSPPHHHFTALT